MEKIRRHLFGKCGVQLLKKQFVFFQLFFFGLTAYAQPDTTGTVPYVGKNKEITRAIIVDGDTIPIVVLDEILLVQTPSFDSDEARRRFYMLRRKVIKVYPYAVIAGNKLDSLEAGLNEIKKKRDQKRFAKDMQQYLQDEFTEQLKKLTRSEGQILSKLIYRETGMSTYDLIKDHRNFFKAFWWNTMANFYEISLKRPYNPDEEEEDYMIEMILRKAFVEGKLIERQPLEFNREEIRKRLKEEGYGLRN